MDLAVFVIKRGIGAVGTLSLYGFTINQPIRCPLIRVMPYSIIGW